MHSDLSSAELKELATQILTLEILQFRDVGQANRLLIKTNEQNLFELSLLVYQRAGRQTLSSQALINNYAYTLLKLGRLKESVALIQSILANDEKNLPALRNMIEYHFQTHNIKAAKELLKKYLSIAPPDDVYGLINMGKVHVAERNVLEGLKTFENVIEKNEGLYQGYLGLAMIFSEMCNFKLALKNINRALELKPNSRPMLQNKLFFLMYNLDTSDEELVDVLASYRSALGERTPITTRPNVERNDQPRFGFVSGDFRKHAACFFTLPLIEGLANKKNYTVHIYHNHPTEDYISKKFQALKNVTWTNVYSVNDEALIELVKKHKIDVLIDTSGPTDGNRLGAFAHRPALLSLSWLGFGSTSGLTNINHFLTDENIVPKSSSQVFTENVLRMNGPCIVYRPEENSLDEDQFKKIDSDLFVFSTNTRAIRLNDNVILTWATILEKVPNSVLRINGNIEADAELADYTKTRFRKLGIDNDRVEIFKESPLFPALKKSNMTLDPFPHNSGTTLVESIYGGVPFLTLEGKNSFERLGSMILKNIGLEEFIAFNVEEYINKAVHFASNPNLIPEKKLVHASLVKSSLMDEKAYIENFDKCIRSTLYES